MAALYALCFPESETPWSAKSFLEFQQHTNIEIYSSHRGVLVARFAADEAEILTLFVDPNARRQGHAQALLNQLWKDARRRAADLIFLEVAADNVSAQAFYKKNGFQTSGLRKNYYKRKNQPPMDAIIMQHHLNSD